jgi:uncharacterized protein involved in cysteine biosynthesis
MSTPLQVQPHSQKPELSTRARGALGDFIMGLSSPLQGLRFLLAHRELWPYAVVPLLINLAVTLLVLGTLTAVGIVTMMWLHDHPYFASGWWGRVQEVLVALLLLAALAAGAAGTYILVGGTLTSIFNERLARQVEIILGTPAEYLNEAPLKQQFLDALRGFLTVAGTASVCFLLGCVPLVNLLATAISFYVNWFVLGYEFFEMPMTLRGFRRKEKRAYARLHRAKVLGLGATVFGLGLIPILGSIILTTAAVGTVLLYHRLPPPGTLPDEPAPGVPGASNAEQRNRDA